MAFRQFVEKTVMRFINVVAIAYCAFFAGCDQATLLKKFTPPEDESIARRYVEQLQQGKVDQIEHDLDPSLVDSDIQSKLSKMAAVFPSESPKSVKVVGAHIQRNQQFSKVDIALEYEFPGEWLLINVTTQRNRDVRTLLGISVTPLGDSLENLNRFTLVGKSPLQYLTLTCSFGSGLFTLYVFILC